MARSMRRERQNCFGRREAKLLWATISCCAPAPRRWVFFFADHSLATPRHAAAKFGTKLDNPANDCVVHLHRVLLVVANQRLRNLAVRASALIGCGPNN